jgi:hypothetical protein
MRKTLILIALLTASGLASAAAELTEFGFQLNLNLKPYREEGRVSWGITIGAYGRITLSDKWRLHVVAGSAIPPLYPFADIELVRVYTPQLMLLGDLRIRSIPSRGLTASALVGGRYLNDSLAETRFELDTFPLSWTLSSYGKELRGRFALRGNLTFDFTYGNPATSLFGQALTLSLHREEPGSESPVIPLGGNLLLAPRLTTHIGVGL